jgi:hypothetical protein
MSIFRCICDYCNDVSDLVSPFNGSTLVARTTQCEVIVALQTSIAAGHLCLSERRAANSLFNPLPRTACTKVPGAFAEVHIGDNLQAAVARARCRLSSSYLSTYVLPNSALSSIVSGGVLRHSQAGGDPTVFGRHDQDRAGHINRAGPAAGH